jgi:hypothetical protein
MAKTAKVKMGTEQPAPNQNVAAMPYKYPKFVVESSVALNVQDETTEEAISPERTERLAVRYISESWTSDMYFFKAKVVRLMSIANTAPKTLVSRLYFLVLNNVGQLTQAYHDPVAHPLREDGKERVSRHDELTILSPLSFSSRLPFVSGHFNLCRIPETLILIQVSDSCYRSTP